MTIRFGYVPVLCCTAPKLFVGASLLAMLFAVSWIAIELAPTGAVFWPVSHCNNQLGHSLPLQPQSFAVASMAPPFFQVPNSRNAAVARNPEREA